MPRTASVTLSDRFRDAIIAMAPEGVFDSTENTYNLSLSDLDKLDIPRQLKRTLSRYSDVQSRFKHLVQYKSVPVNSLMRFYKPLAGTLDENTTALLSIILYRSGLYKKSCELALENLSFGGSRSLISAFCYKIIPTLEQYDSTEFIVHNLIEPFLDLNQCELAKQLLKELDFDDFKAAEVLRNCHFIRILQDSQTLNVALSEIRLYFSQDVSQVLANDNLGLWTKLCITNDLLTMMTRDQMIQLFTTIFNNPHFLQQKFVLRGIIRFAFSQFEHLSENTINNNNNKAETYINSFIFAFCTSLRKCSILFNKPDLEIISLLAYNKQSFKIVWKAYLGYIENIGRVYSNQGQISSLSSDNLAKYLKLAVTYKESITCTQIIKLCQGDFNPGLIANALLMIVRAKQFNSKYKDKKSVYLDISDEDSALIRRLIDNTPSRILNKALELTVIKLYHENSQLPGRLLWNLILGTEKSSLSAFPKLMEKKLASIVSSRPHLEILRFLTLSKVSAFAVVETIRDFLGRLKLSGEKTTDADIKLIRSGLILIDEKKIPGYRVKSMTREYRKSIIAGVFRVWDDQPELAMQLLNSQHQLSHDVVVQSVGLLLQRHKFDLALQVMQSVPNINPRQYYGFLIRSSFNAPDLCYNLYCWLQRTQQFRIPVFVVRRMIMGFCLSSQLSDSRSNRLVKRLIKDLGRRGVSLGTRASCVLVESTILRAEQKNWGSRARLDWALATAKISGVDEITVRKWVQKLSSMRVQRTGYWSPKYYHQIA